MVVTPMPKKGCTYSRNYKTKKCRSKKEHEARKRSAMKTIAKAIKKRSKSLSTKVKYPRCKNGSRRKGAVCVSIRKLLK